MRPVKRLFFDDGRKAKHIPAVEEALEHDFHLLIKPVVPNKLRAMIAFKLNVKAPGQATS